MYPANLGILIIAALMTLPFYFLNRYLIRVIKPKERGRNLLLYFISVIIGAFIYITAGIYLMVALAKWWH
jgi:small-conductance mechanosensitive channel